MEKSNRLLIFVLACLAASNAPAQNPTPTQPPAYVDEAPLPKGWPKPGPYDQVSEKSYPSYRAAFTTENRENGAFRTLFSHIQKNDIPMTAPVEISMAEGDGQNLRQTSLAFLYQDTAVGKTGADGANVEVRDVPAMKTLSYTWQGDRNEANIAKAKAALEAALKDRKIEAKGFRLLGYNGPGIPEIKRTWELQALLHASALATPPVPTSATPPATSTTLGSAAAPKASTVNVENSDSQPAAGEKDESSEIGHNPAAFLVIPAAGEKDESSEIREVRQAFFDLQVLKNCVLSAGAVKARQAFFDLQGLKNWSGSKQQQHLEEKAAEKLKAAVEKAAKKDPKVLDLLKELQLAAGEQFDRSEIRQALSELLALKEGVGSNQQIQEKKAALKAAVERGIKKDARKVVHLLFGFSYNDKYNFLGGSPERFVHIYPELAITLLDQVPQGFTRQSLAQLIGSEWAESDQKAAFAWANQQTDSKIKDAILVGVNSSRGKTDLKGALAYAQSMPPGASQDSAIMEAFEKNCHAARGYQGALAMMQSLPEGRDKELAAEGISAFMALNSPRAAWDLASGIADSRLRQRAEQRVLIQLGFGSLTDPDAASQWMQSLPPGPPKDTLSEIISGPLAANDPQAAFDIAAGIGDSDLRTTALKNVVEQWSKKDPAAATQGIKSSSLPQEVKTQLLPR